MDEAEHALVVMNRMGLQSMAEALRKSADFPHNLKHRRPVRATYREAAVLVEQALALIEGLADDQE